MLVADDVCPRWCMAGHNQKSPLPAATTALASKGPGATSLLMVAWRRVARGARADQRKGVCYDRPYPQQATLQSQFFDFLACRRGNARLHGCRATTSDLTRCDAVRRDQAGAPWRAAARYQLDRSDLSAGNRFATASSRQWRHGIRRFRKSKQGAKSAFDPSLHLTANFAVTHNAVVW